MVLRHDKLVLWVRLTIVLLYKSSRGAVLGAGFHLLHLDGGEGGLPQLQDEERRDDEDGGDAHCRNTDRRDDRHARTVVGFLVGLFGLSSFRDVFRVHLGVGLETRENLVY